MSARMSNPYEGGVSQADELTRLARANNVTPDMLAAELYPGEIAAQDAFLEQSAKQNSASLLGGAILVGLALSPIAIAGVIKRFKRIQQGYRRPGKNWGI